MSPRTSLAASIAVATMALGGTAQAADPTGDAFDASGYTYCDAKLIGQLYHRDPAGGKTIIGQKILNGIGSSIPVVLQESRQAGYRCGYSDAGYGYGDAVALARLWNMGSPDQAKAKVAWLSTMGREKDVEQALKEARR